MASARVVRFSDYAPKPGEYLILTAEIPGHGIEPAGVVLLNKEADELYVRLRRDWDDIAGEEDVEVFAGYEDWIQNLGRELGGAGALEKLDESSAAFRVTTREAITARNFEKTLNDLYREHVPARVLPYRTHLPRYSLAVAAGPFLTNPEDVQAEEWVEVPSDLKLDDDMFIARIQGQSMEPRIPDGSLCVFRRNVVGSRNGRLVLVRNSELADENQYTVKRYKSEKVYTEEGFAQTRIRLESLNPAYPSWDLDEEEGKYQVMAEFVRVLD